MPRVGSHAQRPLASTRRELARVRVCHFCKLPIPDGEDAIRAKTENAWAHFECWFDGMPFERDPATGERLPAFDPEVHDSA